MDNFENFVGRSAQIDEFKNKYQELLSNPDSSKIYAHSYFGLGGIGKTWLLKKLKQELYDKTPSPRYVHIDFLNKTNCINFMLELAEKFEKDHKYKFPHFASAYNIYAKKLGYKSSIAIKRSVLKNIEDATEVGKTLVDSYSPAGIPMGSLLLFGYKMLSERALTKNVDKKAMEKMEADELFEKLPEYFYKDMNDSRKEGETPLVIFVDTYENLVSEVSMYGNPLSADKWLYSENGLIKNIPGVFWVIFGRENLKWEKYSETWPENLVQSEITGFDLHESDEYLKSAGIEDPELRKDIHKLTDGNPFYLSICKNHLTEIIKSGRVPEISMFGKSTSELFDRFIKNMEPSLQELFYMLCAIQKWDDALLSKFISKFSVISYEKAKNLSFTKEISDGVYAINRTVSEAFTDECPSLIKQEAGNLLIDTYLDDIKKKDFNSPDYARRVASVLRGGFLTSNTRDELYDFYNKNIKELLYLYIKEKFYDESLYEFDQFLSYAWKEKDDKLCIEATRFYSTYLYYQGHYKEAEKRIAPVVGLFEKLLGSDNPDTLVANSLYSSVLDLQGKSQEALPIQESVYNTAKTRFGEKDLFTINEMNNYAGILENLGNRDEALTYYEKACSLSDPSTLSHWIFKHNYAFSLQTAGRYSEALPIHKAVLDAWRGKGTDFPYTIYAMAGYSSILCKMEKYNDAMKIIDEAKSAVEENNLFSSDHPLMLGMQSDYALALNKTQQPDEALAILEDIIEKQTQILGSDHKDTLSSKHNKAVLLYESNKLQDAYNLQQEVIDGYKEIYKEEDLKMLCALGQMNLIKCRIDNPVIREEAIASQVQVKKLYEENYPADIPEYLDSLRILSHIYMDTGNLRDCYKELKYALPKFSAFYGKKAKQTKHMAKGIKLLLQGGLFPPSSMVNMEINHLKKTYGV